MSCCKLPCNLHLKLHPISRVQVTERTTAQILTSMRPWTNFVWPFTKRPNAVRRGNARHTDPCSNCTPHFAHDRSSGLLRNSALKRSPAWEWRTETLTPAESDGRTHSVRDAQDNSAELMQLLDFVLLWPVKNKIPYGMNHHSVCFVRRAKLGCVRNYSEGQVKMRSICPPSHEAHLRGK